MASPGSETEAQSLPDPPLPDPLGHATPPIRAFGEPLTLAESLIAEAGWSAANFSAAGSNPPYLRIGGKLWVTLSAYEPCFSSFHRDRVLFRSKVGIAEHLRRYDALMVDPLAFEDCFGASAGSEATFPFGAWLTIRSVAFEGIELWGRRHGRVVLPLAPLAVASAVWLRAGAAPDRRD